jgi:hypothetical protein
MSEYPLSPLEYALYGALCAARTPVEAGSARRMFRLQMRVDEWDDALVLRSLAHLVKLGLIEQEPRNEFGMTYFRALAIWQDDWHDVAALSPAEGIGDEA